MDTKLPWLKPMLWGAVLGAILTMVIGFSWLGWVLESTADRIARNRTDAALVSAMTPACVARFMAQPKAAQKLADLRDTDPWRRSEVIVAGGWATIGATANSAVAAACIEQLLKTNA